jgi:uncharacterized protein YheU (UPF0270 family)
MIVPWQKIPSDTLNNLIKEFILREGTDYGMIEVDLATKIEQIKHQLTRKEVVIVYSELHESVNIQASPR